MNRLFVDEGLSGLRDFSNRVFTLATGALALSVTFKSSIVGGSPKFGWVLSGAWILLTVSILAQLWAQLSQGLFFLSTACGMPKKDTQVEQKQLKWALAISWLCFALGIIAICVFAVINNSP